MLRNLLVLGLLYAHSGASTIPKRDVVDTAKYCYADCTRALEDIGPLSTNSLTIHNIRDSSESFLQCNRDCTFQLDLSLLELMTIQSRGNEVPTDLRLSARGSADKDRYIPSLVKMCLATGLRECLRPLPPSEKQHVERAESGESSATGDTLPLLAGEKRSAIKGETLEATPDAENKKGGRGGGGRGGRRGGIGSGSGGGGGHTSGTEKIGDGWALRVGVVVFLVGWVGFVGLL